MQGSIAVLWIRIRICMDPELLPGSGIIVPDPDLAKSERAYKTVNSGLFVLWDCSTVV